DHHLQRTAREQVVVHEIPVATDAVDAADQIPEAPPALWGAGEGLQVAGRHDAGRQLPRPAHVDPLAVEICALTTLGPGELVVRRCAGDAQHQLTGPHQGDLRREVR